MSVCEHMLEPFESPSGQLPEEKLVSIQNELLWGLTYRNYKDKEKEKPLLPVHSPIHIPFELCRARMRLKQKQTTTKAEPEQSDGNGEGLQKQSPTTDRKTNKKKKRKLPAEKPTLLDRNVWSQDKYMDYLSIPNTKFEEPKPKKYKKRCELEPCPPRFVQLAVPNKRRVFTNWKEYANSLPAEMLMRFEEILHTDQNLEPREARYYYKKLDKQKHKKLRKKRKLEKKKKLEKEKDTDKMQSHIDTIAYYIVKYIQDEPLFALNYKQMLLSDGILDRLEATGTMKKPSRKTKNHYKKTIIEVSDKLAIWIDTLTKFVDVQAIESDTDIPPVSITSLIGEDEGESEGESEYESSTEEELRDSQLFEPIDAWGEEGAGEEGFLETSGSAAETFMTDFLRPGEGEGATDLDNMLTDLDGDALDKLIQILSNCSDDFLDSLIDENQMPDVLYRDVLDRLKELKENLSGAGGKPFLEQIMIDWATRNDPDQVDDTILQKIHEVAGLLGELVATKRPVPGEKGDELEHEEEEGLGETDADEASEAEKPEDAPKAEEEGIEGDEADIDGATGGAQMSEAEGEVAEEGKDEKGEVAEEGKDEEGEVAEEGEDEEGEVAEEGKDEEGEVAEEGKDEEGAVEESKSVEGEEVTDASQEEVEDKEGKDEAKADTEAEEFVSEDLDEKEAASESEEEISEPGLSEAEGDISTYEAISSVLTDEEAYGEELPEELFEGVPEGEEVTVPGVPAKEFPPGAWEAGRVIKGHKPLKVFEHSPDTVCCLSLKTWAVWLLEITHNAHNWTQWMSCVIQKIKEYASVVRGDVKDANGQVKVLRKAEWRKFIEDTESSVIGWRQYSAHVKDLSRSIVENFHGKRVNCCPKCLQDHLITDVVVAHATLEALTEAISCAAYWQRCLDDLVEKTCGLTQAQKDKESTSTSSESESDEDEEVALEDVNEESEETGESLYEIEDLAENQDPEPTAKDS